MEYLASAERGKLKVKTLYCCWKTWIAGLRGSKAERAAVGSVALSPSHQTACLALPYLQQSTGITEALLPEVEAWELPRGSLGYTLHKMGWGRACRELWGSGLQNWLFLLCKGLETWTCAFKSKESASLLQKEHHVQGDHLLEEWMAACAWVPLHTSQRCVCLKRTQARTAASYTDQSRREQRALQEGPAAPGNRDAACDVLWSLFPCRNGDQSSAIYVLAGTCWKAVFMRAGGFSEISNPSKMLCSFHLWRKQGQNELTYANSYLVTGELGRLAVDRSYSWSVTENTWFPLTLLLWVLGQGVRGRITFSFSFFGF